MSSTSLEANFHQEEISRNILKEERKSNEFGLVTHPASSNRKESFTSQRSSDPTIQRSEVEDIHMSSLGQQDQVLEDGQLTREDPSSQLSSNLPSRTSTNNTFLPPVDGGKQAWAFLAAAFVLEFNVWGFVFSYGVFQSFYSGSFSPFLSASGAPPSSAFVSAIGTLGIALPYCVPVVLSNLFSLRPYWVKPLMLLGLVLTCLSMFAGSFSKSVGFLLVTQGIGFGLGGGLLFAPVMLWLPEWFYQKRGLATGIVFSGAGLGGVVFPLIINGLLTTAGFNWTLRFFSLFFLVTLGPAAFYTHPRVVVRAPVQDPSDPSLLSTEGLKGFFKSLVPLIPKARDYAFITDSSWMVVATVQFIQSICYFAVSLYIVDYSVSVGASSSLSTGILSTFNAATILAQTGTGYLVDRMAFPIVMAISCASASLTAYLLLGFANTLPLIFIFVVLFGLVAGGFFATVSGGGPEIARRRNSPISRVIYSLMMVRGLASITGPLIAASLYRSDLQGQSGGYGSHGFAPLVLFVGSGMAISCIISSCFQYLKKTVTVDQ